MSHHNTEWLLYHCMMIKYVIFCCPSTAQLRVISKYVHFSLHCITIFIYSVHELIGSVRLTWADKIITYYCIYQPDIWVSHAAFWYKVIICTKLRVIHITGVMMFLSIPLKSYLCTTHFTFMLIWHFTS